MVARAKHMDGFWGFLEEILIKEEGWRCAAKTNSGNYTEFGGLIWRCLEEVDFLKNLIDFR